jgi:hypothetical protein
LTVVLASLLTLGVVWLGRGVFDRPTTSHDVGTPAEGRRAQQRLFELSGGATGNRRDQRRVTVTLSERELNALLSRHASDDLPLADGGVRLVGNGIVEITGRLPLHAFFGDSVSSVARVLPERWASQPVWLRLRGHIRLETGGGRADLRRLRLEVESLWVGSRRLPAAVLTMLPEGPAPRATRWPVPEMVDSVLVEPGRLTVTSRP